MTAPPSKSSTLSVVWLVRALIVVNIAAIAWLLLQAYLGVTITNAVAYSDFQELVLRGAVDVEALEALRGKGAADNLFLFTGDDLARIGNRIRWTMYVIALTLVSDVIALIALRRRKPTT